jgi:hypothetical protein
LTLGALWVKKALAMKREKLPSIQDSTVFSYATTPERYEFAWEIAEELYYKFYIKGLFRSFAKRYNAFNDSLKGIGTLEKRDIQSMFCDLSRHVEGVYIADKYRSTDWVAEANEFATTYNYFVRKIAVNMDKVGFAISADDYVINKEELVDKSLYNGKKLISKIRREEKARFAKIEERKGVPENAQNAPKTLDPVLAEESDMLDLQRNLRGIKRLCNEFSGEPFIPESDIKRIRYAAEHIREEITKKAESNTLTKSDVSKYMYDLWEIEGVNRDMFMSYQEAYEQEALKENFGFSDTTEGEFQVVEEIHDLDHVELEKHETHVENVREAIKAKYIPKLKALKEFRETFKDNKSIEVLIKEITALVDFATKAWKDNECLLSDFVSFEEKMVSVEEATARFVCTGEYHTNEQ